MKAMLWKKVAAVLTSCAVIVGTCVPVFAADAQPSNAVSPLSAKYAATMNSTAGRVYATYMEVRAKNSKDEEGYHIAYREWGGTLFPNLEISPLLYQQLDEMYSHFSVDLTFTIQGSPQWVQFQQNGQTVYQEYFYPGSYSYTYWLDYNGTPQTFAVYLPQSSAICRGTISKKRGNIQS
jgi:hypothetical protein